MEKGPTRRHQDEGGKGGSSNAAKFSDNFPDLDALKRIISSGTRSVDWGNIFRIGFVVTAIGGFGGSLYAVGQMWNGPEQPPRVAQNPNFTSPHLSPEQSEAITAAIAETRSEASGGRPQAEGLDPYHRETFRNYGVNACKAGAIALEDNGFLGRVVDFLSPAVVEAAPLEVGTAKDAVDCIKGVEQKGPFLSRFGINVQNWDESNFIGKNTIAFWRENLAGEVRARGRDMTPEQMGTFIGPVITSTLRDPNTGAVKPFDIRIVDDRSEAERLRKSGVAAHSSDEMVLMFFDKATGQVVGALESSVSPCDNEFLPGQTTPLKPAETPTVVKPSQGTIINIEKLLNNGDGKGFMDQKGWQFRDRIRNNPNPGCEIPEWDNFTDGTGRINVSIPDACFDNGVEEVEIEVDEDVTQGGTIKSKVVEGSAFRFIKLRKGQSGSFQFRNARLLEGEHPGPTPQSAPGPTNTPTPVPREAPTSTPTPEQVPTPRPTIVPQTPIPTFTPGVPGPTETPQPVSTRIPTQTPTPGGPAPTPEAPTPTAIPEQVPTPRPTIVPQTPIPTNTPGVPGPTETPQPVSTRIPTATPVPAATAIPTVQATPRPTIAPSISTPRPTIAPSVSTPRPTIAPSRQ